MILTGIKTEAVDLLYSLAFSTQFKELDRFPSTPVSYILSNSTSKMEKITLQILLIICLSWTSPAGAGELATGNEFLPKLQLTVPQDADYRKYLGLTGPAGSSFSPVDIKADILLIELFSMYCPYCQQEAANVNELYQKMEEVSAKGIVVKIIGLGAANTQFEVEHFRDTYNVPFPLFSDQEKVMFKALGGTGTPSFVGCRLHGQEGRPVVVLRKSGAFYSVEHFLKELLDKSGDHSQ